MKTNTYILFALILTLLSGCGDDESDPIVTISFETSFTSTSESTNSIFIPLKLEGSSNQEVFVTYEVSGTADFPADVTPLTSTTFLIPAGASAFNIEMLVLEDNDIEVNGEELIIELISVSNGGVLGNQTTHTIQIEAETISIVSFSESQISTNTSTNLMVDISLSEPNKDDLFVLFSLDQGVQDFFELNEREIQVPAGSTFATVVLDANNVFKTCCDGDLMAELEIIGVSKSSVTQVRDFEIDQGRSVYSIFYDSTPTTGSLEISIDWVSTNKNVDLDMFLVDSNGNVYFASANVGTDGTEMIEIPNDFSDGEYFVVLNWFEGDGEADISFDIMPNGVVTWNQSTDRDEFTFASISEASIENSNVFVFVNKNGNEFFE